MSSYDSSSLEVLEGLEPVRQRPGMYTDTRNPNHLCQEVIDNCVDEALAGYAKEIIIELKSDGSIHVSDDGRGIPADIHPEHKISGIEIIMTKLHSGAKFSNKAYKYSGGLHGVGISVVNALSEKLEVFVMRQGFSHHISFANGEKASELASESIAKYKHGTKIIFYPNPKYFDDPKIDIPALEKLLHAKAILCPGLKVSLTAPDHNPKEWLYNHGIFAYLSEELQDKDPTPNPILHHKQLGNNCELEYSFAWTEEHGPNISESYVNLIPTILGGTHVNGLKQGILEAIKEFCELHELMPKNIILKHEDSCHNFSYILSIKIQDPQFAGQTKERLSNRNCATYVSQVVKDQMCLWLNQNPEIGKVIAEKCIRHAESRYRKSNKVSRKKISSGPALPGKLADCICANREDSELFLVEGDSAGGSAKQARDKYNQAILPLRGKILNTWEIASDTVLKSQAIHDIAISIGVDPGAEDISDLRYGKICILADADSDGSHISTLLCALFYRHFYALVKAGKIYIAMPPLYRIDLGKATYYALDDSEKEAIIAKHSSKNPTIQRFKGLGEMNPEQLKETTMATATRRLVQLLPDPKDSDLLEILLAKNCSEQRRAWLERFYIK